MLQPRSETADAMEVLDERGLPLGRVTLPTDPRLFGAEKGTVYLNRFPARAVEARGPAQAA